MKVVFAGLVMAAPLGIADLASAGTAPKPRVAPSAPSWSGFYIGMHAGYGFARSTATSRPELAGAPLYAPMSFDMGDSSPLFGGHIGYSWQSGNWVFGIEGEISVVGNGRSESEAPIMLAGPTQFAAFGADSFMRQEVNWLASVRGRLGYAFGAGLLYATGGAAFANIDYQANTSDSRFLCSGSGCAMPAAFDRTRPGWVIGGGYEWPFAPNWTLRSEYLFYRFTGTSNTAPVVGAGPGSPTCLATCRTSYEWSALDLHTMRLGLSYKWDGAAGVQAEAPARQSWSGFYAGVHGGVAFARGEGSPYATIAGWPGYFLEPLVFDLGDTGALFGGQLGYNWQAADWLFGIEGDVSGAGIRGFESRTPTCLTAFITCATPSLLAGGSFMRQDVNWVASLRGRVGHTWGSGLIYVTGGAAWANIDHEANTADGRLVCTALGCAFPAAFNKTRFGWTVGGGYERPVWSNWTLRGEYLFYRFDGVSTTASAAFSGAVGCPSDCSVTYRWNDLDIHALRVGLNYTW